MEAATSTLMYGMEWCLQAKLVSVVFIETMNQIVWLIWFEFFPSIVTTWCILKLKCRVVIRL